MVSLLRVEVHDSQVRAALSKMSPEIEAAVARRMPRFLVRLQEYIKVQKLSGQVLNRRTSKLSDSIQWQMEVQTGTRIVGRVMTGKEAPYGVTHEFGGAITVPAHTRMMVQAWGRPITPQMVSVRSYVANYPERSFMRTALHEKQDDFRNTIVGSIKFVNKHAAA